MKVIALLLSFGLLAFGGWYIVSEAHHAIEAYAGQPIQPGELYTLAVIQSDPCIVEIDSEGTRPQLLPEIQEELRNLALLRGSPNVEQESYLLADIPPYSGAIEASLHFYGQRILEIHTRGRGTNDLLERRYSMNSRSELIEVRELNVHPKAVDESETSIKPIEFLYQITHDEFAFSYGCILQHRRGERDLNKAITQAEPLPNRELKPVVVDASLEESFQSDFLALLASIKQERAKTVQDALFDSADLPQLPETTQLETSQESP